MTTLSHPPGDRRPIASRDRRIWQLTAAALARAGVSANLISVLGMLVGLAGAALLLLTTFYPAIAWLCFLAAAACIQLRLVANMLDGMVAIASGKASAVGELYNEIPDRISDTALLVAAGYGLTGEPSLGWAAAAMALFITYIRALGKSAGVPGLFQGPMSKSHRMFTLTLACLVLALLPAARQNFLALPWPPHQPIGLMALTLAIIILGGLLTAFRRTARIVRALKERR